MQMLEQLEQSARELDPLENERMQIWNKAIEYANQFLETLPFQPGFTQPSLDKLSRITIEEKGKPIEELLSLLQTDVDAAGINSASGRHLGFIPGGGLWASALADMLSDITNKYSGIAFSGPGAVKLEQQVLQWLTKLVGYPAGAFGNLTSGGSIANLIAIKTARDHHGINSTNIRKAVIYSGAQTHHSIHKAIDTTGLSETIHRRIPLTENFRIDIPALKQQLEEDVLSGLKPFLIVASAGTTDTGAIDPLDEMADLCERYGAWFHVDAAYGGFFMLVPELREKFKGIERSDSVVLDPHKTLFLPFGSGAVLVKDVKRLLAAHSSRASYLADTEGVEEISPADTGTELTRPNRGLRMWLPLQLHGLAPFRACLQEKILLILYFYEEIRKLGFETGPYPDLTVMIFRYPDDKDTNFNQRLIEAIHKDGRVFLSSTTINGKTWLRCAIVAHRTHLPEVQLTLTMIREVKDALVGY